MTLSEHIKYSREARQYDERALLCFALGWLEEESKGGAGKTYTSADVAEMLAEMLGKKAETPAAGTAGESE